MSVPSSSCMLDTFGKVILGLTGDFEPDDVNDGGEYAGNIEISARGVCTMVSVALVIVGVIEVSFSMLLPLHVTPPL